MGIGGRTMGFAEENLLVTATVVVATLLILMAAAVIVVVVVKDNINVCSDDTGDRLGWWCGHDCGCCGHK